jgi:hypothetical protein
MISRFVIILKPTECCNQRGGVDSSLQEHS